MQLIYYGIVLIVLSIAAVPSLLLSRKPDAKELLDKIIPYQGWAGVIFCIAGIWGLIDAIIHIDILSLPFWQAPFIWITWTAVAVMLILLGFILGYSLITKYALSKNETAKAKGEQVLAKLQPLQGTLGIIGVIVGLWSVIAYFILRVG